MSKEENPITKAIADFKAERTAEKVFAVLDLLKNSTVWIPCNAIMAQSDQEQLEELMKNAGDDPEAIVGKTFTSKEQIRMVPDILQNADGYFFPVFSSREEMGEYGEHFSKIVQPFLVAMAVAKNNDRDLIGIVVNAFTDAMVFPWDILKIIEDHSWGDRRFEKN